MDNRHINGNENKQKRMEVKKCQVATTLLKEIGKVIQKENKECPCVIRNSYHNTMYI